MLSPQQQRDPILGRLYRRRILIRCYLIVGVLIWIAAFAVCAYFVNTNYYWIYIFIFAMTIHILIGTYRLRKVNILIADYMRPVSMLVGPNSLLIRPPIGFPTNFGNMEAPPPPYSPPQPGTQDAPPVYAPPQYQPPQYQPPPPSSEQQLQQLQQLQLPQSQPEEQRPPPQQQLLPPPSSEQQLQQLQLPQSQPEEQRPSLPSSEIFELINTAKIIILFELTKKIEK